MAGNSWKSINWKDPFLLEQQLTDDQRLVRDTAHQFGQEKLLPGVREAFRKEETDSNIFKEMGSLGLLGSTIQGYDCPGVDYMSYGLIAREIERVDSGYRSMMSVQSSLVMYPIFRYGSEEHRQKYLPKLATGELIGCFGFRCRRRDSSWSEMSVSLHLLLLAWRFLGCSFCLKKTMVFCFRVCRPAIGCPEIGALL